MNISLSPEARDLLEVLLIAGTASLRVGVEKKRLANPEVALAAIGVAELLRKEIADDQRKS